MSSLDEKAIKLLNQEKENERRKINKENDMCKSAVKILEGIVGNGIMFNGHIISNNPNVDQKILSDYDTFGIDFRCPEFYDFVANVNAKNKHVEFVCRSSEYNGWLNTNTDTKKDKLVYTLSKK